MKTLLSDTARALNAATIRACELANRLDDLGEPFPVVAEFGATSIPGLIATMEGALGDLAECETLNERGGV